MDTKTYQKALIDLNRELTRFEDAIKIINSPDDMSEALNDLREKASGGTFKVLVIGRFSSGKSTMVNALLGETILPERATTATAIITEIRYGEEKKAVVYPKKGQWSGGDSPFEVKIEELKNYLLINHNVNEIYNEDDNVLSGNVIASPFEKMEIFWPLEILKDGVEIIDSPGMDDPTCHGLIAKEYLPNADAIVYVISGLMPYTTGDLSELENIRRHHFYTPILLITRYDNVCEDAEENADNPEKYLSDYRKKVFSDVCKHTDLVHNDYVKKLGGNGVFFVSSKNAKRAKRQQPVDHELLAQSGYAAFEKYLSDYLVKCKGEEILRAVYERIQTIGQDGISMMYEQLNAADLSLAELENNISETQEKINIAKAQAELFVKQFNLSIDKILAELDPEIQEYINGAKQHLNEWKSSYTCSVENKILHPKRTAEAIATEYQAHFEKCYEAYTIQWAEQTLTPIIQKKIQEAAKNLQERANSIDTTIQEIKLQMQLVDPVKMQDSSDGAKVASLVYGLLTFDAFGAVAGYTLGVEGLLKGILTNIGINLALILVFGTVSLPLLIVGEVVNLLIVGGSAKKTMINKVGKSMVAEYEKLFNNPENRNNIFNQIQLQLSDGFDKMKKEAEKIAYADIVRIEADIDQLLETKRSGEDKVEERKAELNEGVALIQSIIDNIGEIHKSTQE